MRTSPSRPLLASGIVVLADLVALREVGIEVVLAVEDRPRDDLALERPGDHQRELDRPLVGHRQRARMPEAHRARMDVGLVAERQPATAEHLRAGRELDVDLEPDHRLVPVALRVHRWSPDSGWAGVEADCLLERERRVEHRVLAERRPGDLEPDREPGPPPSGSASPAGIETAGIPASGIGTVK